MPPSDRIETLRQRISTAAISRADADALEEFDRQMNLQGKTLSDHRHEKLLRHCVIMAEQIGGLAAALDDRAAAEDLVAWINREYDNEETNRDYRVALRVFARTATDGDEYPDSVEWIPSSTSSNYDTSPDPREMIHWEETMAMAEECVNNRDAAMITLQFDAGLRGGEFKPLSVGDVQDHKHGLQVTVEGKQGRRTVTLIPSVPFVNRWLADHPGDSDDDPLWSKLTKPEGISDNMVYKVFREKAAAAGIDKPVTLTNFRKSSAAFLASRNLNQAHIEDHHGWVRGSKAASRYISVFSEDSDRELARVHGMDVESDEPDRIAPLECTRCGRETPRDEPTCVWCGQAMHQQAAAELDDVDDDVKERLAALPPEKARKLLELSDVLEDPEIRNLMLSD